MFKGLLFVTFPIKQLSLNVGEPISVIVAKQSPGSVSAVTLTGAVAIGGVVSLAGTKIVGEIETVSPSDKIVVKDNVLNNLD